MNSSLPLISVRWRLVARAVAFFAAIPMTFPANAETIRQNPGGQIVVFALHIAHLRAAEEPVHFDGTCDSACTLFLSLPAEQLCVTPRASFGFHLPYGVGAQQNAVAADYLISQYPDWVRAWIEAHGGLSHTIIRMGADEAAEHLPVCPGTVA
jgi:hypothetical protein